MTAAFFRESDQQECLDLPGGTGSTAAGKAILTAGAIPPVKVPPPGTAARAGCVQWDHESSPEVFTRIYACVVHVNPEDVPNIGTGMSEWVENNPVIIAGDFNAEPRTEVMDWMYSSTVLAPPMTTPPLPQSHGRFWEAAMCPIPGDPHGCDLPIRSGDPTTGELGSGRKIDYIFADEVHFDQVMSSWVDDPGLSCNGKKCSDHLILIGDLHLAG